jgi:hypothetical protein
LPTWQGDRAGDGTLGDFVGFANVDQSEVFTGLLHAPQLSGVDFLNFFLCFADQLMVLREWHETTLRGTGNSK